MGINGGHEALGSASARYAASVFRVTNQPILAAGSLRSSNVSSSMAPEHQARAIIPPLSLIEIAILHTLKISRVSPTPLRPPFLQDCLQNRRPAPLA